MKEVDGTQGWKVEDQRHSGKPHTEGMAHSARLGDPVSGPHSQKDPHSTNRSPSRPIFAPHSRYVDIPSYDVTVDITLC